MVSPIGPIGLIRRISLIGRTSLISHITVIFRYVKNGFKITKIHKIFEFQKYACYKDVHDRVYEARVAATVEKNNKKATAIKLVSNSMYGQMIMVSITVF